MLSNSYTGMFPFFVGFRIKDYLFTENQCTHPALGAHNHLCVCARHPCAAHSLVSRDVLCRCRCRCRCLLCCPHGQGTLYVLRHVTLTCAACIPLRRGLVAAHASLESSDAAQRCACVCVRVRARARVCARVRVRACVRVRVCARSRHAAASAARCIAHRPAGTSCSTSATCATSRSSCESRARMHARTRAPVAAGGARSVRVLCMRVHPRTNTHRSESVV
jgi:hypothetical protein